MTFPIQKFAILISVVTLTFVLGCAATPTQEGTGEYIDDSVVTVKVKNAIFQDASLRSGEINVVTFKGVVQLSGFVSTQLEINHALEIARNIQGVKSVKDGMVVK